MRVLHFLFVHSIIRENKRDWKQMRPLSRLVNITKKFIYCNKVIFQSKWRINNNNKNLVKIFLFNFVYCAYTTSVFSGLSRCRPIIKSAGRFCYGFIFFHSFWVYWVVFLRARFCCSEANVISIKFALRIVNLLYCYSHDTHIIRFLTFWFGLMFFFSVFLSAWKYTEI